MPSASTLVLFNYDWDRAGFDRSRQTLPMASAGFDLFSFPSNARLVGFDLERFVARLARQSKRRGWQAVTSNHEQFGALAAALLAERMGWPGTPVVAVLACQHKLHARRVLQAIAPEANTGFELLPALYGEPIPDGLRYPLFVKPVKAAFSVLLRAAPSAAIAASFVYRSFDPAARPTIPGGAQERLLAQAFPDALLFHFAKTPRQIVRDFKWLGSYRYGILHLGGRDAVDLRTRCVRASTLLGWDASCALQHDQAVAGSAMPAFAAAGGADA